MNLSCVGQSVHHTHPSHDPHEHVHSAGPQRYETVERLILTAWAWGLVVVQGARLGATAATATAAETHGTRGLRTCSHVPCAASAAGTAARPPTSAGWSLARVEAAVEAAGLRSWAPGRVPSGTRAISIVPPRQVSHPRPERSEIVHPPASSCLAASVSRSGGPGPAPTNHTCRLSVSRQV